MNIQKMSIKEIENILEHSPTETLLKRLHEDDRKGVQKLLKKYYRQLEEKRKLSEMYIKMSWLEKELEQKGKKMIAGVDEVGRGCLAGPVVAAAVVLPDEPILGLYDSKKLTASKRKELYEQILEKATVGIGIVEARDIDRYNIYETTKLAMKQAVLNCSRTIDHLLVDAMNVPVSISQTSVVRGDQESVSIAAASIVAKVTRDEIMKQLALKYPEYGFETNVGYGTKDHLIALEKYGPTEVHRYSFSPIADVLKKWSDVR